MVFSFGCAALVLAVIITDIERLLPDVFGYNGWLYYLGDVLGLALFRFQYFMDDLSFDLSSDVGLYCFHKLIEPITMTNSLFQCRGFVPITLPTLSATPWRFFILCYPCVLAVLILASPNR